LKLKATFESGSSHFSFKALITETGRAFNTGFDTVNLLRPTAAGRLILYELKVRLPLQMS
jgi:hypothetical protein